MNAFDNTIITWLHNFSEHSPLFTGIMEAVVNNDFLKGCILVSFLWFFWFHSGEKMEHNREIVGVSLAGTLFAILIGRLLPNVLPYRLRPILNPQLANFYPDKNIIHGLENASSMPSDHAVMFFALATGIFFISRKAGLVAYLYVLLVICFPRMYLGYHYPSDIATGAIVGITIQTLFSLPLFFKPISKKIMRFYQVYPGVFFVIFFCLTFQIASLFGSGRVIVHFIVKDVLHIA